MGEQQRRNRLAELVREARSLLQMSQGTLADNAHVSLRSVQKLEAGEPVVRSLTRIESALGWSPGRMAAILIVEDPTIAPAGVPLRRAEQRAAEMVTTTIHRRMGPKRASHPTCGQLCPACNHPLAEGQWTTLIPLGPGSDRDTQNRACAGLVYLAVTSEVHWACATGERDDT